MLHDVMGCIRTFLAVTVLFGHSYGHVFTGPALAVQVFYLISGFLISFVLTEAGNYKRASSFYVNRILRLFPVYWAVAAGTLVTLVVADVVMKNSPPAFDVFRAIDANGKWSLAATNLFIFGQDWIMFTGVHDDTFHFVTDFRDSDLPVWKGLLIPPAWTLGVELSFYVVAPFILFRPKLMMSLLAVSLLLRVALIFYGLGLDDPWTYRFFPTELALFLLGAFSHQYWMPWLYKREHLTIANAVIATGTLVILCCSFAYLPMKGVSWVAFLVLAVLSLPFLFTFQRSFRWDRRVGELSYPIYIAHWSILYPVSFLWDRALETKNYKGLDETILVLLLTIAAAVILNRFIARPVENVRRSFRNG